MLTARLSAAAAATHGRPCQYMAPLFCGAHQILPGSQYLAKNRQQRKKSSATAFEQGNKSLLDVVKTPVSKVVEESPIPDFHNAQAAYESKSTFELVRAIAVLRLCRIQLLAEHGDTLLGWVRRVLGDTVTNTLLKGTLFGHFCGGETEQDIKPVIAELRRNGIGGILDYAAESDGTPNAKPTEELFGKRHRSPYNQPARIYDYESEATCDEHVDVFRSCIRAVKNVTPEGFAALKVTALGNPLLLERMSTAIVEAKNLFAKFDLDHDGIVTREEFERAYRYFFNDADTKVPSLLEYLDPEMTGMVDYITWSKLLSPADLPEITASCREQGPLAQATPSEEELELLEAMHARAHTLAKEASECGTRLLIDAEQARFQPAIDNLVLELQKKYNDTNTTDAPIIFNTYQCYLKDALERLRTDVERSERFDYHFGCKLVRGAYHKSERVRAKKLGYPSPIHDTIQDTHQCYNDAVAFLLQQSVKSRDKMVEVMCATHNQESIEKAIRVMNELGIGRSEPILHFAQLFGMADNLTYNLGRHGFRAYKYVPYGKVNEVMPYLMRRAQENSSLMGNTAMELGMLTEELKRRVYMNR